MNTEIMKQFNIVSVLRVIRANGPLARTEVAELLNLSRPSVSDIVASLIDSGWVREIGTTRGRRGRRPVQLEINPNGFWAIGVEVSAFSVTMVICNLQGEIISRNTLVISPHDLPSKALDKVSSEINEIVINSSIPKERILGIGVAMHGIVDPIQGISVYAPILGWHDVNIRDYLHERTGMTVTVDNDCNCSALGEQWFGYGQLESNFITVLIDYGIGAGIIVNGELYRGVNHVEGQVGHITVDEEGPRCTCGSYGCLEVMASESAILRQVRKRLRMGEDSVLSSWVDEEIRDLKIEDIYQAAAVKDALAVDVIVRAARYIGIGCVNMINLFNPNFLVLAGGMSAMADIVVPYIEMIVRNRALGDQAKQTRIIPSKLKKDIYPIGAATLMISQAFTEPSGWMV